MPQLNLAHYLPTGAFGMDLVGSWPHRPGDPQEASDRRVDTNGRAKRVGDVRFEHAVRLSLNGKGDRREGEKSRGEKASFDA
jgi:hypothetical protein